MALRLRRGTNAERVTVTPLSGELIYVTDTKLVYVGDGAIPGGVLVSNVGSPTELTQNLNLSGNNIVGNGVIGDAATSFVGDGSGLTNLPITGTGVVEGTEYRLSIISDDSTRIVDSTTGTFTGIFEGDGSGLSDIDVNQLTDFIVNAPSEGEVITYSGGQWQNLPPLNISTDIQGQDFQINIIGSDSTRIIDSETGVLTGYLVGDMQGDVFGQNSTKIVDSELGLVTADLQGNVEADSVTVDEILSLTSNNIKYNDTGIDLLANTSNYELVNFVKSRSLEDLSSEVSDRGRIYFGRNDINGDVIEAIIGGGRGGIYLVVDTGNEIFPEENVMLLAPDGNVGFGTYSPAEKLDVRGNAVISGNLQAAAFRGTVVADDSSTVIDGLTGNITAPGFVQFGFYTTTERNTNIVANNGMIIYNTTAERFQGYQAGAWINIDDGTTA